MRTFKLNMAVWVACCGISIGHLIDVIIIELVTVYIVSFRVAPEDCPFVTRMRDSLRVVSLV